MSRDCLVNAEVRSESVSVDVWSTRGKVLRFMG